MYDQTLITLTEAAKLLPHRPTPSTLWRWARRGVKARDGSRVRLEHQRLGGKIYTSREALSRFGNRLAQADAQHFDQRDDQAPSSATTAPSGEGRLAEQRRRDVARAEAELDAAGI